MSHTSSGDSRLRLFRILALLCVIALIGAACGGDDSDSDEASGDGSEQDGGDDGTQDGSDAEVTDTTAAAEPEPSGEPVRGGSLVHRVEAETTGGFCLPEAQLAAAGQTVARTMYDTLTVPNENAEMVPWLAESVEPNETFDEWTITLRPGIQFHDGSDLTAEVVKNNLDAYRGAYEGRSPQLFIFVFDNIDTVEVVDDLTLTVTTKIPWPAFPAFLGQSGRIGIMGQAQLDSEQCFEELIGTGPFMLSERVLNDHTTVVRNDDWWYQDVSGLDVPYLDSIEFRPIISGPDARRALEGGELDSGMWSGGRNIAALRELAQGDDYRLVETEAFADIAYTLLNHQIPPFDNPIAREAVALAGDRDLLIDVTGAGILTPASGPFAPGNVGYLEDSGFPNERDLDRAKELVAQYEAETGQPLSFTYTSSADPDTVEIAQFNQQLWQEAGIEVQLEQIADQSQLINSAIGGAFQAIAWRNHPGGDPDLQYVWWCEGCPVNFGKISDPELQSLLDAGRVETDPEARAAIYEDVNRRFADQFHNLWGWYTIWGTAAESDVFGFVPPELYNGDGGFPGFGDGQEMWAVYRTGGGG